MTPQTAEELLNAARAALSGRKQQPENPGLHEAIWSLDKGRCMDRLADILRRGADPNMPWDDYERSPSGSSRFPYAPESLLLKAIGEAWPDACIALLLTAGATVGEKRLDGLDALTLAASMGRQQTVEMILLSGVPVDGGFAADQTALMLAAKRGHMGLVRFLVEKGSQVNAADCGGDTVLHYAANSGNLDIVRYLVDHGANTFFETNGFGRHPEEHAANEEVKAYLIGCREKVEFENLIPVSR